MRSRNILAVLALTLVGSLVAKNALAADIKFDDLTDQVNVLVDPNWDVAKPNVVVPPTQTEFADVTGGQFLTNTNTPIAGSGVVYFVESPNSRTVSDFLTVHFSVVPNPNGGFGTASVDFHFESDPPESFMVLQPQFKGILESGDFQQVEGLFADPATGAPVQLPANITVAVRSDAETVPTPGAFVAGAALLGLAGAKRFARLLRKKA